MFNYHSFDTFFKMRYIDQKNSTFESVLPFRVSP